MSLDDGDDDAAHPDDGVAPKLLLCDDSATERRALAHYLRGQGYEPIGRASCRERV